MAGLQGSGKTTTSAKLGAFLAKSGHHPLLVSTDVLPARCARAAPHVRDERRAQGAPSRRSRQPAAILRSALDEARAVGHEFVIVDTAGRLHIDDELMTELQQLKALAQPSEVLYVADAMTGQDAVKSAEEFHEDRHHRHRPQQARRRRPRRRRPERGRGHGHPVKFAGVGERVDEFELFQPVRMAAASSAWATCSASSRRPSSTSTARRPRRWSRKLRRSEFTLDDYKEQLGQVRKMGSLDQVLSMIPGIGSKAKDVDTEAGEKEMRRHVAIIDSMTPSSGASRPSSTAAAASASPGKRDHGRRREPPAEAIRAGAKDDEAVRWRRKDAEEAGGQDAAPVPLGYVEHDGAAQQRRRARGFQGGRERPSW
jgi:signal recognition particle subunit SRP54